jgi:hypothetical protein
MSRSKLLDEQVEIARLREEGQTLQQIAHRFGKSIYWVNSRLNPSYQPKRLRRAQESVEAVPLDLDATSVFDITPSSHQRIGRLRGAEVYLRPSCR